MEDRTAEALRCANRCVEAAFAQTNTKTAAALLRAGARYLDRVGEEKAGEIVAFPSPAHVRGAPYWATCAMG